MTIARDTTVLVTGAGRGIGEAVATAFAARSRRVIVTDIDPAGEAVAEAIGASFVEADLSDMDAVRHLGTQVVADFGPIDILVNNAGLQHVSPIDEFPDEMWSRLIQIMLTAPFQLMKAVLPGMQQRGWGRIINIASVHGLIASPFKGGYIAAKHGLVGLTRTAALEVAAYGVTVNAICPGYVNTALVQNQIADQARTRGIPESEVVERVILEPAAIKRLVEPKEVAQMALFLAGTGCAIHHGIHTDHGWRLDRQVMFDCGWQGCIQKPSWFGDHKLASSPVRPGQQRGQEHGQGVAHAARIGQLGPCVACVGEGAQGLPKLGGVACNNVFYEGYSVSREVLASPP